MLRGWARVKQQSCVGSPGAAGSRQGAAADSTAATADADQPSSGASGGGNGAAGGAAAGSGGSSGGGGGGGAEAQMSAGGDDDFTATLARARHAVGGDAWELKVSPDMTITEAFQHANKAAHK